MMAHFLSSCALFTLIASSLADPIPQKNVVEAPVFLKRADAQASQADFNELRRAAELSSGAYTACNGTSFDVQITMQINNNATDTQGYVGFSDALKRIAVVMRGSTDAADFQNDVHINLTTPSFSGVNFPADVQVMQGMTDTWGSVHDQVIGEVSRLVAQNPTYTLETTGHSLGGSLTYMSYVALAQNFPNKTIVSNALAAYPVGNQAWADFGSSQNGTIRRGNNLNDGVPNIYTQFVHFGTEFYGNGTADSTIQCTGERDLACSAGNNQTGITPQHLSSFGIKLGQVACGPDTALLTAIAAADPTNQAEIAARGLSEFSRDVVYRASSRRMSRYE